MGERINLHSFRKEVDSTYVGFTPNGGSIKPVHVASGVQRCIYGGYNTTMQIKRLALVSDAKGNVPLEVNSKRYILHLWKMRQSRMESPKALLNPCEMLCRDYYLQIREYM